MDPVTYILDTTMIADRIKRHPQVLNRLTRASDDGHVLGLCDPVRYEVLGGLLKVDANTETTTVPSYDFAFDGSPCADLMPTGNWQPSYARVLVQASCQIIRA